MEKEEDEEKKLKVANANTNFSISIIQINHLNEAIVEYNIGIQHW